MECGWNELEPSALSDTVWRRVEDRAGDIAGMVQDAGKMREGLVVVQGPETEVRVVEEGTNRRPGRGPRGAGGLRGGRPTGRRRAVVMLTRAAHVVAAAEDAVCGVVRGCGQGCTGDQYQNGANFFAGRSGACDAYEHSDGS